MSKNIQFSQTQMGYAWITNLCHTLVYLESLNGSYVHSGPLLEIRSNNLKSGFILKDPSRWNTHELYVFFYFVIKGITFTKAHIVNMQDGGDHTNDHLLKYYNLILKQATSVYTVIVKDKNKHLELSKLANVELNLLSLDNNSYDIITYEEWEEKYLPYSSPHPLGIDYADIFDCEHSTQNETLVS